MRSALALGLAIALSACDGPLGPFSGGELSGEVKPVPSDWGLLADVKEVQLETNPAEPRSVSVWLATASGALYISSSLIRGPMVPTEREWVRDVAADERVRLRIDGVVYELRAVRVLDESEAAAARRAIEGKYELGADDMDSGREVWVFRLGAR
jgi:hypothetical protein